MWWAVLSIYIKHNRSVIYIAKKNSSGQESRFNGAEILDDLKLLESAR